MPFDKVRHFGGRHGYGAVSVTVNGSRVPDDLTVPSRSIVDHETVAALGLVDVDDGLGLVGHSTPFDHDRHYGHHIEATEEAEDEDVGHDIKRLTTTRLQNRRVDERRRSCMFVMLPAAAAASESGVNILPICA